MKLLIKQVRVIDPTSPFNGQVRDIFIDKGIISEIGTSLSKKADKEYDGKDICISPGWVDIFSNFADPGYEYKETLESGAFSAANGGFTDVLIIPNTNPVIQNKAAVEYITQKTKSLPVTIHPIGAITKNTEGRELAEMYDMKSSGAVAFSDGLNCVQSSGLFLKALQYVKPFKGVLIQLPDDKSINPQGLVNEGVFSTLYGLPGKPAMAEELIVARDIKLAQYTESRLHFTGISTGKSLEYIMEAKVSKTDISCSVTPYHLYFCDEDIKNYDTNLKVNPPLRSKKDRIALQQALSDGLIDCIASHHLPHEYDSKILEFEYAKYGMIGLETSYAVLNSIIPELPPEKWVSLLSINPRKIFGLEKVSVIEGQKAILTLFDPDHKWSVSENNFKSKSRNSPFVGLELTGKPIGIVNRDKFFLS